MFEKKPRSTSGLEKARVDALKVLDDLDPTDADYAKTMTHVETLSNLIAKENPSREKLNGNTVLLALANLGGIVTIVAYEQRHVFGSQAAKFIGKFR